MKKRILAIALALCLCLSVFTAVGAQNGEITVFLDGKQIVFDVPPQTINDRTMVPMRAIFEALGATVDWNEEEQSITSTREGITIFMVIDNPVITVNGKEITLDVSPVKIDDRTLVPIRAVAESFEAEVLWDEDAQRVDIKTASPEPSDSPEPSGSPKPVDDYGYFKYDKTVPDFGDFTEAEYIGFEELSAQGGIGTAYNYKPEVTPEEEKSYIAALEKEGFTSKGKSSDGYFETFQKDKLTVLMGEPKVEKDEEPVYMVGVVTEIEEGDINPSNVGKDGFYIAYPTVPDFGAYSDAKILGYAPVAAEVGGYIYLYENTVTAEEETAYATALKKAGFRFDTKTDNYQAYVKGNIAVLFGPSETDADKYIVDIFDYDKDYSKPSTSAKYTEFTAVPDLGYLTKTKLTFKQMFGEGNSMLYAYPKKDLPKDVGTTYANALKKAGFEELESKGEVKMATFKGAVKIFVNLDKDMTVICGDLDEETYGVLVMKMEKKE